MKIQRWVTKFWYARTEEGLEYRKFNREVRRKMKAGKYSLNSKVDQFFTDIHLLPLDVLSN